DGRSDVGGGGGDADRARPVASGSGGVDEVVTTRPHGHDVLAHRLRAACNLVGCLALHAQRDEEAADLRRCRLAAHDLVHHLPGLATAEVVTVEHPLQGLLDHRARKFCAISRPSGVSTDSGWNWTPSTGSSRCLTPITSPSSAVAEISSSSGIVSAASEW